MDFKIPALIVGAILLVLLPTVLKKATDKNARGLIGDPDSDASLKQRLEGLLNWRDLIIAIITGLFVLQFAAAEKIASKSYIMAIIPVGVVATYLTILIIPFMILLVWLLADRLEVDHIIRLKGGYWWLFFGALLPIYFLTGCFLLLS